jgi:hypothetical protein
LVSFNRFSWGVLCRASVVEIKTERFDQDPVLAPIRIRTMTWSGFLFYFFSS